MLSVLVGIFVLHITAIVLLLVATLSNAWWVTETTTTDVWGKWVTEGSVWNYTDVQHHPLESLQVVQASAVLSCIFAVLALFVFVAQLFTLGKGQRFTFSGVLQLISCLCIMIAAAVYTDTFHKGERGWYGHSFILAWVSFVLTFASGVIYVVLRKKSD